MAAKSKTENSCEIVAAEKMAEDIQTADELYGDGMPYELDRIENEIRFYQDQAGQSLVEIGKRFIRIKSREDHGRFLRAIENVGMTPRSAQYAMLAAKKFSNTKSISHLGSTKMIALSVLDDDEVEKLDSGGDIAGMKLDDIDRMSVRELKENLRKEKAAVKKEKEARKNEREAFKKSMIQKDEKINELDMKMSGMEPPTKGQIAEATLYAMNTGFTVALAEMNGSIRNALSALAKAERVEGIDPQQLSQWLNQFVNEICTFNELCKTLSDGIENPTPAEDNFFDIIEGKADV